MRVFVAIKNSDDLANKILEWEEGYKNLPARWLKKENLHITLIPPWQSDDVESIKSKLKQVEKVGEFDIAFNKVSFGPNREHPRLIWAEGKSPDKLKKIRKNLEDILSICNEHPDDLLHVTLARFDKKDFSKFPIKKLDEKIDWRDKIKSIILYQSQTLPEGAEYTILHEEII